MKDKIGQMRQQIQIQTPSTSQSATTGEMVKTFSNETAIWAGVDYQMASGEKGQTDRKTDITKVLFTMYFDSTVTEKHRILYRSEVFEILSISPDEKRQFMTLEAQKVE